MIVIKRRKGLLYRNAIISTLATAYIAFDLSLDAINGNFWNAWNIMFMVFVVMQIAVIFSMMKQILTKTPALVISEEGITDNISLTKPGLIGWEEISDCDLRKYRGYIQLLISLHDNDRIYAKANKLNQAMIKIGVKDTGASIIINTKMLDCDPKQLRDDILQHLGKVRLDEHLVL